MEYSLLKLLRCPETKQSLRLANKKELEELNLLITTCSLTKRSGKSVKSLLENALIREDGRIAYPIFEGIPLLLIEEGLLMHYS